MPARLIRNTRRERVNGGGEVRRKLKCKDIPVKGIYGGGEGEGTTRNCARAIPIKYIGNYSSLNILTPKRRDLWTRAISPKLHRVVLFLQEGVGATAAAVGYKLSDDPTAIR